MTPQEAAKAIIEMLKASGVASDVYASMNALADDHIDAGMDLDEIEEGLTIGFENGWFDLLDGFISVTSMGESFYWSSLSDRIVH